MFGYGEAVALIELAGLWPMPTGWQVVIRAEWCDVTPGRPHGLSYALILQDEKGERLLGFDNSHGFDGAGDDVPFDHEHRFGRVGQRFRYDFTSPSVLVTDFFDRVKHACDVRNVPFKFEGLQL
jgi:hypothetical protein